MTDDTFEPVVIQINGKKKVTTRSKNQSIYVEAIRNNQVTIGAGVAGTGKTFLAVAVALEKLHSEEVEKIIITRPMVEAGESMGTLPGTIEERSSQGLQVLHHTFELLLGIDKFKTYVKAGTISHLPLTFARGHSIYDFLICDEAQNMTKTQMKLLLTRIGGSRSKFVINGDDDQVDLRPKTNSGLRDSIQRVGNIDGIAVVELGVEDVQRSKIVREIIKAYDD